MASTFKWATPGAWAVAFGAADLNSLANGTTALSSLGAPQINNSTSLEYYAQFEFVGGSISPSGPADVVVFLLPIDSAGAAYMDGEATGTVANQPIWLQYPHAIIGLRTKATSAQLAQSGPAPTLIPPGQYKVGVLNRAGVALAASGNQVNWRLLTEQGT
jgi:hypothetical protein